MELGVVVIVVVVEHNHTHTLWRGLATRRFRRRRRPPRFFLRPTQSTVSGEGNGVGEMGVADEREGNGNTLVVPRCYYYCIRSKDELAPPRSRIRAKRPTKDLSQLCHPCCAATATATVDDVWPTDRPGLGGHRLLRTWLEPWTLFCGCFRYTRCTTACIIGVIWIFEGFGGIGLKSAWKF